MAVRDDAPKSSHRPPPLAAVPPPSSSSLTPDAKSRLIGFRLSLLIAISVLVIATGGLIIANSYFRSRRVVTDLAERLFDEVSRRAVTQTRARLMHAPPTLEMLQRELDAGLVAQDQPSLARLFLTALQANPEFSWVSYGNERGDFTGAYRLDGGALRVNLSAQHDDHNEVTESDVAPDGAWNARPAERNNYDPRRRPWYGIARGATTRVWTEPYVFFHSDTPGITATLPRRGANGALEGVFTIDFDLRSLSEFVATLQPSAHGQVFVFTHGGTLLAHPTAQIVNRGGAEPDLVRMDHVGDPVARTYYAEVQARGRGANSGQFVFAHGGQRYLASFTRFQVDTGVDWVIGAIAPEEDFMGDVHRNNVISLLISLGALFAALAVAAILAQRISVPLVKLAGEMEEVGEFKLVDRPSPPTLLREMALMNRALSNMKNGLRSFASYVPRDLVRLVLESGEPAVLGGRVRNVTIYFSDLAGFTTIAETMKPDELVAFLGGYLDAMTRTISTHHGTVDKFIGDGIMAFWGAPGENPDHAAMACEAALACEERLAQLKREGGPELQRLNARIGLATGEVLVGNIGTPERMNYTVMGDVANLAARLEGLNKAYQTALMVSEDTYRAAKHRVVARPVDLVAVKGKARGIRVYELLTRVGDGDAWAHALAATCEAALDAYLARDFAKARGLYDEVLATRPNDPVARAMRDRCQQFEAHPPDADWNGVYVSKEK